MFDESKIGNEKPLTDGLERPTERQGSGVTGNG